MIESVKNKVKEYNKINNLLEELQNIQKELYKEKSIDEICNKINNELLKAIKDYLKMLIDDITNLKEYLDTYSVFTISMSFERLLQNVISHLEIKKHIIMHQIKEQLNNILNNVLEKIDDKAWNDKTKNPCELFEQYYKKSFKDVIIEFMDIQTVELVNTLPTEIYQEINTEYKISIAIKLRTLCL